MDHDLRRFVPLLLLVGAGRAPGLLAQEFLPMPPLNTARSDAASAVLDLTLYVIGGADADGVALASVERFNAATNTWEFVAPLPAPRIGAAAAVAYDDNRLYLLGGIGPDGDVRDEMYAYTPAANSWQTLTTRMPAPRTGHACVRGYREFLVFGGLDADGVPTATAHRFRPGQGGKGWSALPDMPTARAGMAGFEGYPLFIHVIGGRTASGPTDAHEQLNLFTLEWQPLAPLPTPRAQMVTHAAHGYVHLLGGETGANGAASNANEIYILGSDSWDDGVPIPDPRTGVAGGYAAVGYECGLILAGGSRPEGPPTTRADLYTGARREDWNHDGIANSQDFFDYTNDYFAGNGDFNGDTHVNSQDFFDFLTAYFGRCF